MGWHWLFIQPGKPTQNAVSTNSNRRAEAHTESTQQQICNNEVPSEPPIFFQPKFFTNH
ncbi:MAG TPA: hypothetical protein PKD78_04820 [Saprospiraceae bacterium]|nr:hypothetical protein [Saprospiraceae bacterium]